MDIDHLSEFVYLADTLSFKRTAEHFYVSRSVISRHLAALEESLGAKLVNRSNQAVELTAVGETFYRDAKTIIRDFEVACEHVRMAQDNRKRTVRIGYLRNAARPVIVRFSRLMKQGHPEIDANLLCMEYSDLRRAMDDGTVDVALGVDVDPSISRNFRSTSIYTDRFYAVMSKDHPLAKRTGGIEIDDLPDEKLLLPDSFVYSGLSELIDGLVEKQSQLVARAYYRDIDMLYLKVQTEGYIALSSNMNNAMFKNTLAIVPVLGIDSSFSVSAFYGNHLEDDLYEICREAFEKCRFDLTSQAGASGESPIGLSLDSFE